MFNSTIFDVAFGLVSVFLSVSLFTSAVTEGLSMLVGLRARTLLSGVKQLLNDPDFDGLARSLYNHALVNPLSDGQTEPGKTPSVKPSYVAPRRAAHRVSNVGTFSLPASIRAAAPRFASGRSTRYPAAAIATTRPMPSTCQAGGTKTSIIAGLKLLASVHDNS